MNVPGNLGNKDRYIYFDNGNFLLRFMEISGYYFSGWGSLIKAIRPAMK